jgi:adenylate kinase family enzyme
MGFVILTGASGSGKTAISEAIASRYTGSVDVYHFDQVGVPSAEEMIANYGSTEAWQLAKTHEWMAKIAANRRTERHALFEGQMRCSFALEAAAAAGITEFMLILVDCDDATRIRRLTLERRQPDLANPTMMSWARYLRNEAHILHCTILDTTLLSLEECVRQIWTQFSR